MTWPDVIHDPSAMRWLQGDIIASDLEWDIRYNRPTIVSASDGKHTVAAYWEEAKPYFLELVERHKGAWAGHNFLDSDLQILAEEGIRIPPERVLDSIVYHWLVNLHLCKTTNKTSVGDEEGVRRGRGFMNLWCFTSLYTMLPCWKKHRGSYCSGPCPECSPLDYCGLDSFAVHAGLPEAMKIAHLRGVDSLYPMHRDLILVLAKMRRHGVMTDQPYLEKLRCDFQAARLEYWNPDTEEGKFKGLFNPRSPIQVKRFFKEKYNVALEDASEETLRECSHRSPERDMLLEYKELGDGPDRWFKPRKWNSKKLEWEGFVWEDSSIYPSLGIYTSSGRLNCVDPNLQNVAKHRVDRQTGEKVGKRLRRAIVPHEGYMFVKGDLANAENRVMLYYGGYEDIPSNVDLHTWVKDIIGIKETDEFAVREGSARDAAKTGGHANHYGEGLALLTPDQLRSPRIQREVAAGARLVYPGWKFCGHVVSFTGAHLAERAFGDASWANRRKALEFSQQYFARFPGVREAQRQISVQCERGFVQPPTGYLTLSYGYEAERLKSALAIWGSQPIAHLTKLALLRGDGHPMLTQILQTHDEILYEVDRRWENEPRKVADAVREVMEIDIPEMPGLKIPVDIEVGLNSADTSPIYKRGEYV